MIHSSFSYEVALSFGSMIRMLHKTETTVTLVAITINAPFECMELWANQSTFAPRQGSRACGIPDDPGISKEEAFPVYEVFDRVFVETFPQLKKLPRVSSALYIQWLMRNVSRGLIEEGQDPRGSEEYSDLLRFSEGVVAALKASALEI